MDLTVCGTPDTLVSVCVGVCVCVCGCYLTYMTTNA